MNSISKQSGFSAIELLITLFIAAIFLITGFELYAAVINNGAEVRRLASANSIATDYIQRYKSDATKPCTAQNLLTDQVPSPIPNGLSSTTTFVSVGITCPYTLASSISEITVTVKYGNPQQTIVNSTYTNSVDGNIVTNGLVLNLDAGNQYSIKGKTSIIKWDSWTVGTGAMSDYSLNGDGNSRVVDTNPWGASDVVWDVSNQDAASDADGGWNTSNFSIDNTKMYRFSTWVRRKTIGNGSFYLGTHGYPSASPVLNRSNGASNSYPYFSGRAWWGNVNQWYLVVGYIWPAGSGTGSAMPDSGIYDLSGTKLYSNSDYVWQSTTTSSNHRSYLYYSTDITTNQQWYQPRVDIVNGAQPSITELINNAGNNWYDLSGGGHNGTSINGVGYTTANGEALSFNGSSNYIENNAGGFLPSGGSTRTIMFWFKPNAGMTSSNSAFSYGCTGGSEVMGCGDLGMGRYVGVWANTSSIGIATETCSMTGLTTPSPTTGWHLFTAVFNVNNTVTFYVDGSGAIIRTPGCTINSGQGAGYAVGVGRWGYYNGNISSVNVYNRALSATEIKQNYNALRGRYGL